MSELSTRAYSRARAAEILVVDDDRALCSWLCRALEREGYAVRAVHDGRAALEAIEVGPPTALLLDVLLPRIDGFEIVARLKQEERTRELPMLLMSGVYARAAREIESRVGVEILAKPFTEETLRAALRRLLGSRAASRAPRARELDLAAIPAAELIYRAIEEDFCGAVYFSHADVRKALVLDRGELAGVYSNQVQECLGQRLLQAGRISASALAESIRRVQADGCRQGSVLVEMGQLSAFELEAALRDQAHEKLLDVFAWERGRAWLKSGVRELRAATSIRGFSIERLLRDGVARTPAERLRRLLEAHATHTIEIQSADLRDLDSEDTLRSLESGFSVASLMLTHPHATYRGWRSGRIRLRPYAAGAAAPSPEPAATFDAAAGDLFRALHLDVDADTLAVEAAFSQLAPAYAPERHRAAPRRERQAAAHIYARLCTARSVLRERAQREAYRSGLIARAEDPPSDACTGLTAAVCSEAELARAEQQLRSGDSAGARRALERVLLRAPDSAVARALYGWALFLEGRSDPQRASQALATLRSAVESAPELPAPLYYLAMAQRASGDHERARKLFRRVLALDPTHTDARRELERLRKA